jgi:inhibitor of KinA sporulation pathway (predicted exonuclease)
MPNAKESESEVLLTGFYPETQYALQQANATLSATEKLIGQIQDLISRLCSNGEPLNALAAICVCLVAIAGSNSDDGDYLEAITAIDLRFLEALQPKLAPTHAWWGIEGKSELSDMLSSDHVRSDQLDGHLRWVVERIWGRANELEKLWEVCTGAPVAGKLVH